MPIYPDYKSVLVRAGERFTAEWYYTAEGRMPAAEHYAGMDQLDRDRFGDLIRYLCNAGPGTFLPKTAYRVEDRENKIYALKPRSERFFNFTTDGAKIILTNAYRKHSQQMAKSDLDVLRTAVRYRRDYLARVQEGSYYEI